jgi:YhcH/YjgK/YiaL family protein
MIVSSRLTDFTAIAEHCSDIQDFLAVPHQWNNYSHGEKLKTAAGIAVVFLNATGSNDWENILEAHQKFYDLHYCIEGQDCIVSKPVKNCTHTREDYNELLDYSLYNEVPEEKALVQAGNFCLIPPADAHMALYGDCGLVKKLVFKIPFTPTDAA